MNFSPVTPEFNRVRGVHPSSISSLATFVLLLDLAGISTAFSGGDYYSVSFHLYAIGRYYMPSGLHARLCHAFPVGLFIFSIIVIKDFFLKFHSFVQREYTLDYCLRLSGHSW